MCKEEIYNVEDDIMINVFIDNCHNYYKNETYANPFKGVISNKIC
jgi:hypothetical protein